MLDHDKGGALFVKRNGTGLQSPVKLMYRMYRYILPEVAAELAKHEAAAKRIPDAELRHQALASLASKRFHCQGGAAYAAACLESRRMVLPFIVAYQTISDYLDNLCDRSTSQDEADFRLLHQSMLDALEPGAATRNYYANRKEQEDGGYLQGLVRICQEAARQLPSYAQVKEEAAAMAALYGDLQVYKHLSVDKREQALLSWWRGHQDAFRDLGWNEFAAATGSTLGLFALMLAATQPELPRQAAARVRHAYFPAICGLHIMLDYLIDQAEDRAGGDLNFCFYYASREQLAERIKWLATEARNSVAGMPDAAFHQMIIEGLLALYLSDRKVRQQEDVRQVARKLMQGSPKTRLFFWVNSLIARTR